MAKGPRLSPDQWARLANAAFAPIRVLVGDPLLVLGLLNLRGEITDAGRAALMRAPSAGAAPPRRVRVRCPKCRRFARIVEADIFCRACSG